MQYSGSSFSQMIVDLLGWVLLPRRQRAAVSGPFPATTRFRTEVPDPVLDRALLPTFAAADGVLASARVLHRGTIQIYLLYVIGILLFLLLIG